MSKQSSFQPPRTRGSAPNSDDAEIDLDTQELTTPVSDEPLGYGPGEWASPSLATQGQEMANEVPGPVAKAQMLVRKPIAEVFNAFVDPAITSRFWFSKGSGRLEAGKRVRWDWEMYGVFAQVDVKALESNRRILIEWNGPDNPSSVEWRFETRGSDRTFVTVKNWNFRGTPNALVTQAIDSTGGFSLVLAALKAFLEHGIELNVVADHDPDALVEGWTARRTA
jgi:uncharacterized protein YndB with AHSA1/START domain